MRCNPCTAYFTLRLRVAVTGFCLPTKPRRINSLALAAAAADAGLPESPLQHRPAALRGGGGGGNSDSDGGGCGD